MEKRQGREAVSSVYVFDSFIIRFNPRFLPNPDCSWIYSPDLVQIEDKTRPWEDNPNRELVPPGKAAITLLGRCSLTPERSG
jgi:hypothetical protein